MAVNLITLENVEKQYDRHRVLQVKALAFKAGEQVVLSGRNGSGKSTLLRLLGRIIAAERGTVWHADVLLTTRLGYVPQSGGLYMELSVEQNFAMRRKLYGLPSIRAAHAWYVQALSLDVLLKKRISELSGGFQRLVCIVAALHVEPRWLLLDEPFSGLDAQHRTMLAAWLVEVSQSLELCVLTTPSAEEFSGINRVIRIEEGQLR